MSLRTRLAAGLAVLALAGGCAQGSSDAAPAGSAPVVVRAATLHPGDRMFLDLGAGSLVDAVAKLGRSLGLTVVAEGVETPEQLALVRAARCDAVQGFLISRALPEPDARLFLERAAGSDEIAALMAPAGT